MACKIHYEVVNSSTDWKGFASRGVPDHWSSQQTVRLVTRRSLNLIHSAH